MANNKAFEVWSGLPPWAKGVIAVGGVAIAYFIGRSVWKKFKTKADTRNQRETLNTQNKELKNLQNKGQKTNYSESQYRAWADKIQNQFDGIDWRQNIIDKDVPLIGSWSGSGKTMKDIVEQLKNNVDFLKLSQAYGIRTYDAAGAFTGNVTGDLQYAISDELDRGEIMALNNILVKKGITYKF